jgi:hypothetical protein
MSCVQFFLLCSGNTYLSGYLSTLFLSMERRCEFFLLHPADTPNFHIHTIAVDLPRTG